MTDETPREIPKWIDLGLSYEEALHGVQTAVKYEMTLKMEPGADRTGATSPKHLRVGVNAALVEHSAVAFLLMKKGIFTEAEYLGELRLAMNHEVARYQQLYPPFTFR